MLNKKTKYGLHALVHLAREYPRRTVLISQLARAERIPQKFLEAILLELKKSGILDSKKGKGGGYSLAHSPDKIFLGKIIRILEGPLAPVSCVSQTAYRRCLECRDEKTCGIRLVMKDVREAMANILDKTSLSNLLEQVKFAKYKSSFDFEI